MSSYHYSFYSPHRLHCLGFLPQISLLAEDILPQISQIYTELLAEDVLPQISQIYTEVRLPSRGCTCLKCTNQARSAPTKQNRYSPTESTEPTELLAECILPQIAQIDTELLAECILPQISQIYTEVRLRKIVAEVSLPPQLQSDFHRWHRCNFRGCTSCSVGALETSAPP